MDYGRWTRRLEWAFASLVVALVVVLLFLPENWRGSTTAIGAAQEAQVLTVFAFASVWLMLGPGWLRFRWTGLAVLGLVTWLYPAALAGGAVFAWAVSAAAGVIAAVIRGR